MIKHTFLDKVNTIVKGSKMNMGLNPVAELNYGKKISRAILHFDESELKKMDSDGFFPDKTKLRHVLKLTNCMSQDGFPYEKKINSGVPGDKMRAASFDVILFLLPKRFDAGRGFNFVSDGWLKNGRSVSTQGSNWYFAETNNPWECDAVLEDKDGKIYIKSYTINPEGIYSPEKLQEEYDKYLKNLTAETKEDTIVVAAQHFDFGNENFELDITETVNKILDGELSNNGFGLAFAPKFEEFGQSTIVENVTEKPVYEINPCSDKITQVGTKQITSTTVTEATEDQYYIGFFTNRTNTFFHPYLETIYDDVIRDDRARFYLGKKNRIYFYSVVDNEYVNLDSLPTCQIDGASFDVKCGGIGAYYVEIEPSEINWEPDTIHYDMWSNLAVSGQTMPDVELEFVAIGGGGYFQLGAGLPHKDILVPQTYGIDDEERIRRGEIRRIVVDFRKKYTTDKKDIIDSAEYRIFTKDATREIDVFPYHPVEKTFMENFFFINTNDLVPGDYYVDFRVRANGETRYYREKLRFTVVSNITEFYD